MQGGPTDVTPRRSGTRPSHSAASARLLQGETPVQPVQILGVTRRSRAAASASSGETDIGHRPTTAGRVSRRCGHPRFRNGPVSPPRGSTPSGSLFLTELTARDTGVAFMLSAGSGVRTPRGCGHPGHCDPAIGARLSRRGSPACGHGWTGSARWAPVVAMLQDSTGPSGPRHDAHRRAKAKGSPPGSVYRMGSFSAPSLRHS